MKKTKGSAGEKPEPMFSHKERLLMAFMSVFTFVFVILIFGCIDIYANNSAEILFTLKDFIWLPLGISAALTVVLTLYYSVMRTMIFNILTAVTIILPVGGCLQQLVFGSLGILHNGGKAGSDTKTIIIIAVFWVVITAAILLCAVLGKKKWKGIMMFICILVIGMNGVTLVTDFVRYDIFSSKSVVYDYALTSDNMLNLSDKENIVVLVVDRFDNTFLESAFDSDPQLKQQVEDDFEGFTYFSNATSLYGRTFPAVPYLISGVEYPVGMQAEDYLQTAYKQSDFLSDLKSNGYNINLYIKNFYCYTDANALLGIADNAVKTTGYKADAIGAGNYLISMSFARYIPGCFEELYFVLTESNVADCIKVECGDSEMYNVDDAATYTALCSKRLTADANSDKNYTLIHLQGTHSPYTLTADCKRASQTSLAEQTEGSLTLVTEYIEQMKALGVYDNSTIIITADHGSMVDDSTITMEEKSAIALFVKPRNAARQPMKYSTAQVSHTNLFATIVKDASIKTDVSYGRSAFDIGEDEMVERTFYRSVRSFPNRYLMTSEYRIVGDANNLANWKYVATVDNKVKWY